MYEPIYQPNLANFPIDLGQTRFGVLHYKGCKQTPEDDADPLHCHAYMEIYFHVMGAASFLVNGQIYPLRSGDAVVSRSNDLHMCVYEAPGLQEHYCLWIGAEADAAVTEFTRQEKWQPLYRLDPQTWERLRGKLDALEDSRISELERTSLFLQILVLLEKHPGTDHIPDRMPQEFRQILAYIDEQYPWIQRIGELARIHFISEATLNRWFQKYLHISPKNYLDSRKLSHAAKMLSQGAAVTEACNGAGFNDCSHFIGLFRKKFGQTPLQYQRSFRQGERQ